MSNVLIVAVHPDDETLGCGGTLLKHRANGDEIYWCIVTSISKEMGFSEETIQQRNREIEEVRKLFRFCDVYTLNYPTTAVDQVPTSQLVQRFSTIINKCQPETLYLPFHADVHSDHRIVFHAAFSCTKSFRHPFLKKIYMMETLSETEFAPPLAESTFAPNSFVDITEYIEQKINIMKIYREETAPPPFPRSLENLKSLATIRGGAAGCRYAESFMLLKEIS